MAVINVVHESDMAVRSILLIWMHGFNVHVYVQNILKSQLHDLDLL